jgi:hypothetical protein
MKHATTVKQEIGMMPTDFNLKQFILTTLIVSIWINISEVFRYFVIVKPMMGEYLSILPGVVPMNWSIFASWGVWDTILTALVVFVYWLVAQRFGSNLMSTFISATTSWALFFLLFWLGLVNMGLSSVSIAFMTLPLALLEMVVACLISSKLYTKNW